MLRTLDDYLTFISLILITVFSLRFCIGSMINRNKETDTLNSRHTFLMNYLNNEEE